MNLSEPTSNSSTTQAASSQPRCRISKKRPKCKFFCVLGYCREPNSCEGDHKPLVRPQFRPFFKINEKFILKCLEESRSVLNESNFFNFLRQKYRSQLGQYLSKHRLEFFMAKYGKDSAKNTGSTHEKTLSKVPTFSSQYSPLHLAFAIVDESYSQFYPAPVAGGPVGVVVGGHARMGGCLPILTSEQLGLLRSHPLMDFLMGHNPGYILQLNPGNSFLTY